MTKTQKKSAAQRVARKVIDEKIQELSSKERNKLFRSLLGTKKTASVVCQGSPSATVEDGYLDKRKNASR